MTVLFDVTPAKCALDTLLAYSYPAVSLSPTIRILNAASRTSRADELAALLRDMDETRSAVASLETGLKEIALRLHQRRAAVATAMAPVTGLPTEVLRENFLHVAETNRTSKARIVLSHVSSSWRAVSLGLMELWTIIQVPPRCPQIMHEFASRSGDLRLELSALSSNNWPHDLDLNQNEVSRLATIILRSSPYGGLDRSFEKFKNLVNLDKLVVSSKARPSETFPSRLLELVGSDIALHMPIRLNRLTSLTFTTTYVKNVNSVFRHLSAPNLSELRFVCLDVDPDYREMWDELGYEEDDDDDDAPEQILLTEIHQQITSLTIVLCDLDAWLQMCDNLRMPALTSLTIEFKEYDVIDGTASHGFSDLLKASTQLEHLDITMRDIDLSKWKVLWGNYYGVGIPVPKLRTLRLASLRFDRDGKHPGAKYLSLGMVARTERPDVEPLQRFVVTRNFVREEDEEKLRDCVGELVLMDQPAAATDIRAEYMKRWV